MLATSWHGYHDVKTIKGRHVYYICRCRFHLYLSFVRVDIQTAASCIIDCHSELLCPLHHQGYNQSNTITYKLSVEPTKPDRLSPQMLFTVRHCSTFSSCFIFTLFPIKWKGKFNTTQTCIVYRSSGVCGRIQYWLNLFKGLQRKMARKLQSE